MSDMVLKSLSEYIIANAPMTNLPELLSLHHGNPLGLHPIVIPLFLLVMAAAMHITTQRINKYDKRIRCYTPYIFIGLGVGTYGFAKDQKIHATAYVPLGIGFKWKFHEFIGLNIAWQHNIYMADNIEGRAALDNKHQLNGWNWMNCDLTGMLTAGIVFEFARAKKECRICNW